MILISKNILYFPSKLKIVDFKRILYLHSKYFNLKKLATVLTLFCSSFAIGQSKEIKDIPYYSEAARKDSYINSQCKLDIYIPESKNPLPVIIWFHGGSLTYGSKNISNKLKNDKYIIVSVDYRLSPKVKAPAYIEDAAEAVAWVFNHIQEWGGDSSKVFLSGHSAGGYLAMMLTMDSSWLSKRNIAVDKIKAAIPLSPQVITHFTIRKENNISSLLPVIDAYAPINFVKSNTPLIIDITGDRELELYGRYEENAYFIRMMKLNGNKKVSLYELQGFNHGDMLEPGIVLLFQEADKILNIGSKRLGL